MEHIHPTMRPFVAPFAPSPITPEALEALQVRADLEYQQHREDARNHRALRDQQQQAHLRGELA